MTRYFIANISEIYLFTVFKDVAHSGVRVRNTLYMYAKLENNLAFSGEIYTLAIQLRKSTWAPMTRTTDLMCWACRALSKTDETKTEPNDEFPLTSESALNMYKHTLRISYPFLQDSEGDFAATCMSGGWFPEHPQRALEQCTYISRSRFGYGVRFALGGL